MTPDFSELDEEQISRINLYARAFSVLRFEDRKYESNHNAFVRMPPETMLWYIAQLERQARSGHGALAHIVVAKAIAIKLES